MATFQQLRQATLQARERTGDATLGIEVHAGNHAIVRAIPPASGRGKYTIDYQTAGLTSDEAVAYLNALRKPA